MLQFLSLYRGDNMTSENKNTISEIKNTISENKNIALKNFLNNDDAVSISVGFILTFSLTVLIFVSVILSFYSLSHQSEKTAMQESFNIIGHRIAVEMVTTDSMVNTINSLGGTVNSIEYEFTIPDSIAANTYSVNITNSTHDIIMESDNGAKVMVPFNISAMLFERKFYSGAEYYKFEYYKDRSGITIKEQ